MSSTNIGGVSHPLEPGHSDDASNVGVLDQEALVINGSGSSPECVVVRAAQSESSIVSTTDKAGSIPDSPSSVAGDTDELSSGSESDGELTTDEVVLSGIEDTQAVNTSDGNPLDESLGVERDQDFDGCVDDFSDWNFSRRKASIVGVKKEDLDSFRKRKEQLHGITEESYDDVAVGVDPETDIASSPERSSSPQSAENPRPTRKKRTRRGAGDAGIAISSIGRPKTEGKDFHRLSNEDVLCQLELTLLSGDGYAHRGTLIVTNFRLMFFYNDSPRSITIYLLCVSRVDDSQMSSNLFKVYCKNMRILHFICDEDPAVASQVVERIKQFGLRQTLDGCYAHFNRSRTASPPYLDLEAEYARLSVNNTRHWRISYVNLGHRLCPTYPEVLCVPMSMNDEAIEAAASFRSKKRLPVLVWMHPHSRAFLARAAQPLSGMGIAGKTWSAADIKLIDTMSGTSSRGSLLIADLRPQLNAMANTAKGGGYEDVSRYKSTRLHFMGIDNIHAMRKALHRLREATNPDPSEASEKSTWLHQLASSRWLDHLSTVLLAANKVVTSITRDKLSVLIHCSDGWDRTAQVASLAELMLDPYYRTIEGFGVLVEKEWLAFGHKFAERTSHAFQHIKKVARPSSTAAEIVGMHATFSSGMPVTMVQMEDERSTAFTQVTSPSFDLTHHHEYSPIFLQFLDCVWQISQHYPCAFEFNSRFLVHLMDIVEDCSYPEFLFNNDKARRAYYDKHPNAACVWRFFAKYRSSYLNPFYSPGADGVLEVSSNVKYLKLWSDYFLRWDPENPHTRTHKSGEEVAMALSRRIDALTVALQTLASEPSIVQNLSPVAIRDLVGKLETLELDFSNRRSSSPYVTEGRTAAAALPQTGLKDIVAAAAPELAEICRMGSPTSAPGTLPTSGRPSVSSPRSRAKEGSNARSPTSPVASEAQEGEKGYGGKVAREKAVASDGSVGRESGGRDVGECGAGHSDDDGSDISRHRAEGPEDHPSGTADYDDARRRKSFDGATRADCEGAGSQGASVPDRKPRVKERPKSAMITSSRTTASHAGFAGRAERTFSDPDASISSLPDLDSDIHSLSTAAAVTDSPTPRSLGSPTSPRQNNPFRTGLVSPRSLSPMSRNRNPLSQIGAFIAQSSDRHAAKREGEGSLGPIWVPDSAVAACFLCKERFSVFIRKHHCRLCGRVFCNACSPHRAALPGSEDRVRVCNSCYDSHGLDI